MKAFVTGGAGFIGSNIVRLLCEKGYQVVVYDNLSTGYLENLRLFPRVEFIQGDIADGEALKKSLQGCDTVFHLAASIGNAKSIAYPLEDSTINVIGTLKLVEAVRENGVKTVVYSSSAGIFGEPQYLPVDEKHPCEPDSPYGVSKMAGEKQLLCMGRLYGFRVVSLRYFNVFGVNQRYDAYGNVIPIFVTRVLQGKELTVFDDGEQTRDFVNVKDVAFANVAAAENDTAAGVFNIGSGAAISINSLVEALKEIMPGKVRVNHAHPRPGDVRHSLAAIDRARGTMGYAPQQEITAGLREYVGWMSGEEHAGKEKRGES